MNTIDRLDNAWVAVHTKTLYEKVAAEHLVTNGYECFLPLQYRKMRKTAQDQKRKRQPVLIPLFPGYLFCRFKTHHNFLIKQATGVKKLIGYNGIPTPIPDCEIESLQKVVISGLAVEPYEFLRTGQKVVIHSGPLSGLEGYLVQVLNKKLCKIAVGVSVIEKSGLVTVCISDVSMK